MDDAIDAANVRPLALKFATEIALDVARRETGRGGRDWRRDRGDGFAGCSGRRIAGPYNLLRSKVGVTV